MRAALLSPTRPPWHMRVVGLPPKNLSAGAPDSQPGAGSNASARRLAGTSEPAAAAALAGLRREVQVVMAELCTMAAVAQPLQLLPQALACLQGGQLQFIFQPQARSGPGRHARRGHAMSSRADISCSLAAGKLSSGSAALVALGQSLDR
jgi:hypothetical protein